MSIVTWTVLFCFISLFVGGFQQQCDVTVDPGESIQNAVDSLDEHSVICLSEGIFQLQRIVPKIGQSFIGAGMGKTILNGANEIDSSLFSKEGDFWVARDPIVHQVAGYPSANGHGSCEIIGTIFQEDYDGHWHFDHPRFATHPDESYCCCNLVFDLFMDDKFLWRMDDLADLGPGSWYMEESTTNGSVYMYDDPNGHKIDLSRAYEAFPRSGNENITVKDLTITKYANRAQLCALEVRGTAERVEVSFNHGRGISMAGPSPVIRDCHIHHNGQFGLEGGGQQGLFEYNEVSYNGGRGYMRGWGCGGIKFVGSLEVLVRRNFVHHNFHNGLWTDINNHKFVYEDNIVVWNVGEGIKHEISCDVIIRNNDVRFNSRGKDSWLWGAQILIQNSRGGEVYNNFVGIHPDFGDGICIIDQNRGSGTCVTQPEAIYEARDNYYHDNFVFHLLTGGSGMMTDFAPSRCGDEYNNEFDYNIYSMPNKQWGLFKYCSTGTYIGSQQMVDWGQEQHGIELLTSEELKNHFLDSMDLKGCKESNHVYYFGANLAPDQIMTY